MNVLVVCVCAYITTLQTSREFVQNGSNSDLDFSVCTLMAYLRNTCREQFTVLTVT